MTRINEFPDLNFEALELKDYFIKNGQELSHIKITEYFPRVFKFRSLDLLRNDIYVKKIYISK
jgi:hypothetical protein